MIRTLIWFTYFWIYQIMVYPKLKKADQLLADGNPQKRDELVQSVVPPWAGSLLKLAGCEVTVQGAEGLNGLGPVLFVANHQSNFDIPILIHAINQPKAFIAKDSLENIPGISRWMKHMNCVFMNRENVRQSAVAINQGIAFLKQGYSMVIFPEGTRSLTGELGEFKAGALKLATKANVPIVPVTIKGSIDMMKKKSWAIHPAKVTLILDAPILPDVYSSMDTVQLSEQIYTSINTHLKG